MRDLIFNIFGSYTPNTYDVIITTTNPETGETIVETATRIADGMAGVDFEFLAGVFLFGICLWSMFVFIGSIFGGRR